MISDKEPSLATASKKDKSLAVGDSVNAQFIEKEISSCCLPPVVAEDHSNLSNMMEVTHQQQQPQKQDNEKEEDVINDNSSTDADTDTALRIKKLENELDRAKVDAKESLTALLQFAECVKTITRHMHNTVTNANDATTETPTSSGAAIITDNNNDVDHVTDKEEETKSPDHNDKNNNNNNNNHDGCCDDLTNTDISTSTSTTCTNLSLQIETMISQTSLQGTTFGTDLLNLWNTAQHVNDYASTITKESSYTVNDIIQAQTTSRRATKRAKRAEKLSYKLYSKNLQQNQRISKLTNEKKILIQQVKTLQQQVITSRQLEMERLLQQHVIGALLLHESQLKKYAISTQQQQNTNAEEVKEEMEDSNNQEEYDLELVQVEDCQADEQRQDQTIGQSLKEDQPKDDCDNGKQNYDDDVDGKESSVNVSSKENLEFPINEDATDAGSDDTSITTEEHKNNIVADEGKSVKCDEDTTTITTTTATPPRSNVTTTESNITLSCILKDEKTPVVTTNSNVGLGSTLPVGLTKFFSNCTPQQPEKKKVPISKPEPTNEGKKESNATDTKAITSTDSKAEPTQTSNKENELIAANQNENSSQTDDNKNQQSPAASKTDPTVEDRPKNMTETATAKHNNVALSAAYAPVKLFPSFGRAPPVQQEEKPISLRSISSAQSSSSSQPPPPNNGSGENVGKKVFNFLFYPERINHQPYYHQQESSQEQPKSNLSNNNKKPNATLNLAEPEANTDEKSVDSTIPTIAATSPGSSYAESPATTIPGVDRCNNSRSPMKHESSFSKQRQNLIPNCVSFSDDTVSVQSNLHSPVYHPSPKHNTPVRSICDTDKRHQIPKSADEAEDVEMYKNLKVFRSLAIPSADEIGDYRDYEDQQALLRQDETQQQQSESTKMQ